jgi:hypothetical protein
MARKQVLHATNRRQGVRQKSDNEGYPLAGNDLAILLIFLLLILA